MEYTLLYSASRSDVWRWYWKAWRAGVWRTHLAAGAATAFLLSGAGFSGIHPASWALWFLAAQPAVTLLFAAVPQILFKRAERTLHVDPKGWSTQIGGKSGARTWVEVASIGEESGSVVIAGANGNALIIPGGAFPGAAFRQRFIEDIRQWHRGYPG